MAIFTGNVFAPHLSTVAPGGTAKVYTGGAYLAAVNKFYPPARRAGRFRFAMHTRVNIGDIFTGDVIAPLLLTAVPGSNAEVERTSAFLYVLRALLGFLFFFVRHFTRARIAELTRDLPGNFANFRFFAKTSFFQPFHPFSF